MNDAPVFVVDDDIDDVSLLEEAWKDLGYTNPLKIFKTGEDVLEYLKAEPVVPFLIICEFNLPRMNGYQLKNKLLKDKSINYKSIPFVFLSGSALPQQVQLAYDVCTNGFFIKEVNFENFKKQLIKIVDYWLQSKVPL